MDGGGTRSVALLVGEDGRVLRRIEAGPANVKLLTDAQLVSLFRSIAGALPKPSALGIGLAGAWAAADSRRIRLAAAKVWPRVPCHATNDLETALLAATESAPPARRKNSRPPAAQVLVVSGTGSCAFGKSRRGDVLKIGGWGHVLGDNGSAYQIGMRALRTVVESYDANDRWPKLGAQLLRALLLNEPGELIGWAQSATKTDVASLAVEVFTAAEKGDALAKGILDTTLSALTGKALTCANRLARRGEPVQFFLAGSVLLKQPRFAHQLAARIRQGRPDSRVHTLGCESVWGAVELARRLAARSGATVAFVQTTGAPAAPLVYSTQMSPTEQRNPRSMQLDRLTPATAIKLMLDEDARIRPALLAERRNIERALRLVVKSFQRGGRLFYAGAGTSGRLGVLDAAECPVTFRTPPEMVQAIIAGGQTALWKPVEGAEDDLQAGANAVYFRGLGARDILIGIAASGTTPFVWGALRAAQARGARTVLLAFNPFLKIPRAARPDVCITPNLGAEILTGSTRLKAGTATKLVLNTLTTLAMVRLGKISSNLMVDVIPTNVKLRDRATRIVCELTGVDYAAARAALETHGWVIKKAAASLARKSCARRV